MRIKHNIHKYGKCIVKWCKPCGYFHPFTEEYWACFKKRSVYDGKCRVVKIKRKREYNQRNWESTMLRTSRNGDKHYKRYDEVDFITKPYIQNILKVQKGICYYCPDKMLYGVGINRQTTRDAVQIERINNNLPHYCFNCVLCCCKCQGNNHPLY
jgi:hypothetical protein